MSTIFNFLLFSIDVRALKTNTWWAEDEILFMKSVNSFCETLLLSKKKLNSKTLRKQKRNEMNLRRRSHVFLREMEIKENKKWKWKLWRHIVTLAVYFKIEIYIWCVYRGETLKRRNKRFEKLLYLSFACLFFCASRWWSSQLVIMRL